MGCMRRITDGRFEVDAHDYPVRAHVVVSLAAAGQLLTIVDSAGNEVGTALVESVDAPVRDSVRPAAVPAKRRAGPGAWLAAGVVFMTFGFVYPCASCQSRAAAMDKAGWRGLPGLWWKWLWRR